MFLSSVDIAFAELNAGVQSIQRMYAASQYMLSLGCNIRGYLADRLPDFSTAHPQIGIRQLDCTTQQLVEHLLDRSINLALSNEPLSDDRINFRLMGSKNMSSLSTATTLWPQRKPSPLGTFGTPPSSAIPPASIWTACARPVRHTVFSPQVGYEIQSTDLVYSLLAANRGVAIVPVVMGCHLIATHPDTAICIRAIDGELPPGLYWGGYSEKPISDPGRQPVHPVYLRCAAQRGADGSGSGIRLSAVRPKSILRRLYALRSRFILLFLLILLYCNCMNPVLRHNYQNSNQF